MPNFDKIPTTPPSQTDRSQARSQAAAWAWYQHAGGAGASSRGRFNHPSEAVVSRKVLLGEVGRAPPSRFKVEAELGKTAGRNHVEQEGRRHSFKIPGHPSRVSDQNPSSEFMSSLFDSFELRAISKQLDESVRREATKKGHETESWSGGTATPRIAGSKTVKRKANPRILRSNTGKESPFEGSRQDRALFSEFRIGRPFCRSTEVVSCQAATKSHAQAEKQSLTAGYTNLDVPLFKRRSSCRAGKKHSKYAQPTEENQESRHRKTQTFLRMISLKDASTVLQEVNHLPQFHSGRQRSYEHHRQHLHHDDQHCV